jgi:hypothetical protein
MIRVIFASILIVFGAACAFSQQPVKSDAALTCTFPEMYKMDGWIVPGVQGAKVKQHA